jgi:predicted negative regulator of RcsB-dependent stress response
MLEKALEVAIKEKGNHADMVRTNLARVLSALGKHSEAIEHLNTLAEPSFHSQCILAHAYFKGNNSK